MKNLLTRFVREEEGQDLIEYSLLAALISIVCITVLGEIGTAVNDLFGVIRDAINDAAA
jgi:pilus assembly protein Flp/PilA